jgi:hypothetical protein
MFPWNKLFEISSVGHITCFVGLKCHHKTLLTWMCEESVLILPYFICNCIKVGTSPHMWHVKILMFINLSKICKKKIYSMSQEERSIIWEVIVSIILSKEVYIYIYICRWSHSYGFRDKTISPYGSTLYTVQTNNTSCPHTSCKVHWSWRWNFRKCIILGNGTDFVTWTINTDIRNSTYYLFLINNFGTVEWNICLGNSSE